MSYWKYTADGGLVYAETPDQSGFVDAWMDGDMIHMISYPPEPVPAPAILDAGE